MAILGKANFLPVGNTGAARAKKLADIYIKSNSDASGNVSDPNVYKYAIDNYLSPFGDDLSIQQKIAGYQNNVKSITEKRLDQSITLSSFKRELESAVYTSDPRLVKDPWMLAQYTSDQMDKALFGLNVAIDHLQLQNKSVDQLLNYRTELNNMAGAQRELVNNLAQNTSNPNLDGYGYYVKINPANGALLGTALLPSFAAPTDLTSGTKRLENNLTIGNSKIPVYIPANKNADGEWEARLYGDTWKGTGDTPLSKDSGNNFKDGSFSLGDSIKFPVKSFDLQAEQFGKKMTGVGDNGNNLYTYYYRGNDGNVYSINQDAISKFKSDPIMAKKLDSFVPTLGEDDVRNFGSVQPLNDNTLKSDKVAILTQQTKDAVSAQQTAADNYKSLSGGVVGRLAGIQEGIGGAIKSASGFFSNLMNRKNEATPPTPAPVSTDGTYSTPDVVGSGQSFFRSKPQ